MPEMLVILVVAILVIGPKRLPDVANALGKGLAEFKRAMNNVKEELKIDEVRNDVNEIKDSLLFKNSFLDEEKEPAKEEAEVPKSETAGDRAAEDKPSDTPSQKSDSGK
jgi:TatA/E family protein of Tat protein translocase